ncbi:hypothetical protein K505DRAFT_282387 [Melanomma pulvis-pyrius CBS 109.77]|uniref:BTB domain-containing protein n=1 Tax=Melanomma pulvis-pyrius CBS 109.77 TaxID=1314802 RepID=A0A6A6X2X7_9PLEO|nr:hypothetical protein K505DRAFT_282387 [Melanomma pulvis-pyrius CBS 109.77]
MFNVIHRIDPNADTVIILKSPLTSFAVWSPAGVKRDAETLEPVLEPVNAHPVDVWGTDVEEPSFEEAIIDGPAVGGATDTESFGQAAPIAEAIIETNPSEGSTNEKEIYYYVSSRHLRLASPKFESMLSSEKWTEGVPDENDGLYHISAEDWDTEALLLLLNVLHLRNRQVPRSVSLEMLAKIAVLIDYYECAEAVELCSEAWVKHLRATSPIPSEFCRDLVLWMCIAWVLRLPHEFTQTTAVAIRRADEEFPTLGLPITGCVDRIDQARMQAIGTVISKLQDLLNEYRNPLYQCAKGSSSFECGSILYGALTKGMELAGLLEPYPVAPFPGLGVWELYEKVKCLRSPSWCSMVEYYRSTSRHPCSLSDRVVEIADTAIRFADGLDLKDFKRT